ncbi:MAG: isochorismate synthase [Gemmatimonadetes bacterium]|jgi:isochorismate synthase|nr:isochorismate synthase [Gemmatimonadota bacterium]
MNEAPDAGFRERLAALAARAVADARRTGRRVLVSVAERVAAIDPLAALRCTALAGEADPGIEALLRAGRMFWSHAPSELAFAAIGAAVVVAPSGATRFADADREWRELLSTAIVDGVQDASGIDGPALVGGFAFDPTARRSDDWRAFPDAHLIVPALRLTASAGRHTLTTSFVAEPHDARAPSLDTLLQVRDVILASSQASAAHEAPDYSPDAAGALRLAPVRPDAAWRMLVERALREIQGGSLHKVVVARAERASAPVGLDVLAALAHLRTAHPTAYVFAYWRESAVFTGATPERLVRLRGRILESSSLAGSAARGASPAEDRASAARLVNSAKDQAEHALVLTALRSALAHVAEEVTADDMPSLLTLPNVHHLHTAVRATLREGHTLLQVAGALHPTPAVGGAPRDEALAFLRAHEELDRGWYAAPIGWVAADCGELVVALRSALVSGGDALLFAGCGIVAASDPEAELNESRVKLGAMEATLAVASTAVVRPAGAGRGAGCT